MEEPTEGAPASERTEVRALFDDKNLYVGIRAFDSEPTRINSRELVRDASFSNDDKVEILLDTYHDRRNAFRFAVNPLGTQQDALITDEGRDVNLSWDAPWVSAGHIDQTGVGEIRRRRLREVKPYASGGWRQGVPQVGEQGFDSGL